MNEKVLPHRNRGKTIPQTLYTLAFFTVFALSSSVLVYAGGNGVGEGENVMNQVLEIAGPLVQRLGLIVAGIGGVMFGLGFKNDDADSRTRGLQTIVGGAICAAVATGMLMGSGG